jgi:hypothetical protein
MPIASWPVSDAFFIRVKPVFYLEISSFSVYHVMKTPGAPMLVSMSTLGPKTLAVVSALSY